MRENRNYRTITFLTYVLEKIKKKNSKKIQKIKNLPLWHHFKAKQVGKGLEREKIKVIITFRSYPTRTKKLQKNSKKIQKIK